MTGKDLEQKEASWDVYITTPQDDSEAHGLQM